jgi:hypothetical protein
MFIIGPLYFLRFSAAAFSLARSLPTRLIRRSAWSLVLPRFRARNN